MTIAKPGANDGELSRQVQVEQFVSVQQLGVTAGPPYPNTALEWEADYRLRNLEGGGGGGGGAGSGINVTQYGVIPSSPSGTDVTAALNTLISTQVAAAQASGTNFLELYFPPGVYRLSGALTQGGATKGNAQINLPIIAPTAPKFTLILRSSSVGGGNSLPHWQQTTGQRYSGAVLYTTLTGQTYSGTFGTPSILAGPTSEQGYGNSTLLDASSLFNNMHVIINGISACNPGTNPSMNGFDFFGMAEATVGHCGAFVDAPVSAMNTVLPSNAFNFGLRMPAQGNNAICNIAAWSCEGYYTGLVMCEHVVCTTAVIVYCQVGIRINSQTYAHGNFLAYATVESCLQGVQWDTYTHAMLYDVDFEHNPGTPFFGGNDINDGANQGRGYVGFEVTGPGGDSEGTEPIVNGATNLKIVNIGRKSATFNIADVSPLINIPATTVPLKNPFWRDAIITIVGGTLTGPNGVQVNTGGVGARTLFTTTPCTVPLPSGAFITLTYSVVPTAWVWTLI